MDGLVLIENQKQIFIFAVVRLNLSGD